MELGRPDLLRPWPSIGGAIEDGVQCDGPHTAADQMPADVYVPQWFCDFPARLDFAVASGLRINHLRNSAHDASAAALAHEGYKFSYMDTYAH